MALVMTKGTEVASPCLQLAGPRGSASQLSQWDSAFLTLHGHQKGRFELELWRFSEGWAVPCSHELAPSEREQRTQETPSFRASGQPRASVLIRDETRVTLRGCFANREIMALRFTGFRRRALNQVFAEDETLQVGGLPTWWSVNGRFFLYFAAEYGHWKINGRRESGGDGLLAVQRGGRRTGRGFVHSGPCERPVCRQTALASLCCVEGWFQVVAGEWTSCEPLIVEEKGWSMDFRAESVDVKDIESRGQDTVEHHHSAREVVFHMVRLGVAEELAALWLPEMPSSTGDELQAFYDSQEDFAAERAPPSGTVGEPDFLLMGPVSASKL